ncbi:MAG: hypothetical protein PHF20_07390 [Halothiobacillaceae bacterium]|nr:hypothetical protein [Halothiobacillaceae bacterium]
MKPPSQRLPLAAGATGAALGQCAGVRHDRIPPTTRRTRTAGSRTDAGHHRLPAGTTHESALARNRLVLALAAEVVIPHVTDGSPLAALIEAHRYG